MRQANSGGPKATANFAMIGARKVRAMTPTVLATKPEIADMPIAGPARPLLRELVPVVAEHHRRGLRGDVQQDRRRRSRELGAVVEARHHDQPGGGGQLEGQRQQHRQDGRRITKSGKDSHDGAEGDTDEHPHQVHRGQGRAEPVDEALQCVQRDSFPGLMAIRLGSSGPEGSGMAKRWANRT